MSVSLGSLKCILQYTSCQLSNKCVWNGKVKMYDLGNEEFPPNLKYVSPSEAVRITSIEFSSSLGPKEDELTLVFITLLKREHKLCALVFVRTCLQRSQVKEGPII